jgi:rSAM/selenodomain-associated transferase 1
MRPLVMVFAKVPAPFAVKTRLIPAVGAATASRLHSAFVLDTLACVGELNGQCDVVLYTDREGDAWPDAWSDAWNNPGCAKKVQVAGGLGTRMLAALQEALAQGYPVAAIVGSDSPTLPARYLAEILECPEDICFGPASDGGFYAIACRRIDTAMFDAVAWSSPDTLAQTTRAAVKAGLTFTLGEEWYDVDCADDLDRLAGDPGLRPFTREALREAGVLQPGDSSRPVVVRKESSENASE